MSRGIIFSRGGDKDELCKYYKGYYKKEAITLHQLKELRVLYASFYLKALNKNAPCARKRLLGLVNVFQNYGGLRYSSSSNEDAVFRSCCFLLVDAILACYFGVLGDGEAVIVEIKNEDDDDHKETINVFPEVDSIREGKYIKHISICTFIVAIVMNQFRYVCLDSRPTL